MLKQKSVMNKNWTGASNRAPVIHYQLQIGWLFLLLLLAHPVLADNRLPSSNPTLEAWVTNTVAHGHAEVQLRYPEYLGLIYRQARFQNFWLDAEGQLNAAGRLLAKDLQPWLALDDHPKLKPYQELAQLLASPNTASTPRQRQARDLVIMDYFLRVQEDLLSLSWNQQDQNKDHGILNAYERWDDWPDEVVASSLAQELGAWLHDLKTLTPREWAAQRVKGSRPEAERYQALRLAFDHLQQAVEAGTWPQLQEDLQLGSQSTEVQQLAWMLMQLGDLNKQPLWPLDSSYDEQLAAAVRSFQERHQLAVSGQVDAATRAKLNISPSEKQRRLAHNLRRLYHLPQQLNDRHLMINLADQQLQFIEQGKTTLEMKVVIGRGQQRTPIMSQWLTSLVLNPIWNVPPNIARRQILPRAESNPDYLASRDYALVEGWHTPAQYVDWEDLPEDAFTGRNSSYRIIQKAGQYNQLGRAKFRLSNQKAIYLHDTPYRQVFSNSQRAVSAGCVRVEDSASLVDALLAKSPNLTPEVVDAIYAEGEERYLQVRPRVAVYLMYWTAWVDDQGRLQWREDIYKKDRLRQDQQLAYQD